MGEEFEHKKSLGQHFLNSPVVPGWLVDAAEIVPGEVVVEIGPGTGALTEALLNKGAKVIALEADTRALEILEEKYATACKDGLLILIHTDVRDFNLSELNMPSGSFKIVANIPYYLSGLLFRTCLAGDTKPNTLVFLVQKEVAKRATTDISRGEKESLLSLSVKVFGQPKFIKSVSRHHFTPSPKVDSGIIAVRNVTNDNFKDLNQDHFFILLHLGFGQKRKQLLGNLANQYERGELETIFSTLDIPLNIRAEDLAIDTWIKLANSLSPISEPS